MKLINKMTIVILLLFFQDIFAAPDPATFFKINIDTNIGGVTNTSQFRIPTASNLVYNYSVDCDSNGSFENVAATGDYTCDYSSLGGAGRYLVSIVGNVNFGKQGFPRINFNNGGDKSKVTNIAQWGASEWQSMDGAFWGANNMTVSASDVPNFDRLTNLRFMFNGATLANPNTNNWEVGGITNMTAMFQGASSANPNVSSWNTENVQLMNSMFAGASNAEPDMSQWDIGNVTDMTEMFEFVSLQKSTYDAALKNFSAQIVKPNVFFHAGISQYCAISQHLDLSNPNTNNWTITDNSTSTGCYSDDDFQTTWDTGTSFSIEIPTTGSGYYYRVDWNNDGDMNDSDESIIYTGDATHIFSVAGFHTIRLKGIFPRIYFNSFPSTINSSKITNINQWGTIEWESMRLAFAGAVNLNVFATDSPDLSQVTSMADMFNGALIANPDTSMWDTSNVTNMLGLFKNAASANPDVSQWDTSNVSSMLEMFDGAIKATPDTSLWQTSQVTNMNKMFKGAVLANPDTSLWDTLNVLRMDYMFDGALLAVPDTSNWDTSKVESMDYMFRNANFANPDTKTWNINSIRILDTGIVSQNRYGFRGMFSGVKLNINSYDDLLNNFASTANFSDLELDAGNSSFCTANSAKFFLENQKNWTITDAGQNCTNESNDFVIVVKTDNPGSTTSTQFRIPVLFDLNNPHNYSVSCQDNGAFNSGGLSSSYTCNYNTPGTYRIRIVDASTNGTGFPNIYFNNTDDRLKILDVRQWGTSQWKTMRSAFWGAANMIVTAKDAPDLSQASSLENMFRGAIRANPDMKNWDVSTITTMKRMFAGNYVVNPDTSLWNTSSVQDMSYMFYQAYNANPDMSNWDIGQVNILFQMFNDVTLPIPSYDAALINFDSQVHNPNINFTAGNSMYCDGLNAHANLISDGWNITDSGQECTPNQPTFIPIQLSSATDNTPQVRVFCSSINNTLKIFFTGLDYNFTEVASHLCSIDNNFQNFSFTNAVDDGLFRVQTTETKNGDESAPSLLPLGATFLVDTSTPDPTSISLSPNPATNGTTVFLQLFQIEWKATVSITGMTCSPNPADQIGLVDCSGVVGQNGLDGNDNTITIVDELGNTNTNNSTGLIVTASTDLIFTNGFEIQ